MQRRHELVFKDIYMCGKEPMHDIRDSTPELEKIEKV